MPRFSTGHRMKFLAAFLLLAAADALALPGQITAEYQVMSTGVRIARVSETFSVKSGEYTIQSVTRSEGPLKMFIDDQVTLSSQGKVVAAGLKPMRFGQHRARDARRDVEATFDWERGVMTTSFRGETSENPLPGGTQDRLSLMYQFMKAAPRDGLLEVPMSNGRKIETYTYRFVAEERIATPAGEFDTLHFQRVTASPKESHADVWLAKDRFNFPVRIVFDDPRGLRLEQSLVSFEAR
jgi:hypothetical protein